MKMVLKRSLGCGFIGYNAPTVPRARRSARRRSLHKKTLDEGQLCAFELLAAVAGKLLQETESSSASSNGHISKEFIKQEPEYHVNEATKTDQGEPGISEESVVSSALCLQTNIPKGPHKEAANASTDATLKQVPSVATSACSAKVGSDVKPFTHRSEEEFKVDDKFGRKDQVESCVKSSPLICSGEKANMVPCRVSIPDASYVKDRNGVKLDGKDDDEILSRCSDPKVQDKAYRIPTHTENGRIRKLLTSNYWKSAPKLKEYRPINSGSKRSNTYNGDRFSCDNERFQPNAPFKKRKLVGQSSVITHDRGISSESASNTSDKAVHNRIGSPPKPREGNGLSSSTIDCQRSSSSKNSHVRFSIKSFKVPELLIEVPESATVGSLKSTVMDAVTTVLGGGLHVGVLLRGKKIRNESKTLLQNGLSEDDNLNDLAFILEPSSPIQPSPNLPRGAPPVQPASHPPKDYSNRSLNPKEELPLLDTPKKTSSTRICRDLVPFTAPELENKPVSDSRALVPAPENVEALAAVPLSTRPRRSEMGQRRTRRPFSVSEVEALVQAVEKLGTGRWRDVKLCAFENAKHRTYVDLKDKWKTLVHTAKIAPQQRRGEPVPQKLLDRVLAAHSHWSHHQARQQQPANASQVLKLSDSFADKVTA